LWWAISRIYGTKSTGHVKRLLYAQPVVTHAPAKHVAIFWLLGELIHLMILAIIAAAVLSILLGFGVVNARSRFIYSLMDFLNRVTAPVLNPIRSFLPLFGNVDLSPLVAILILQALQFVLSDIYGRLVMAGLGF
jgi:YggT family protein